MNETIPAQRLDKWLWHARFAKTRTLAQKMVTAGCVRINRQKVSSPSRQIKIGEFLTLSLPKQIKIIEVVAFATRRGPFRDAQLLYKDHTPVEDTKSKEADKASTAAVMQKEKRPDRDARRKAIQLKQNFTQA